MIVSLLATTGATAGSGGGASGSFGFSGFSSVNTNRNTQLFFVTVVTYYISIKYQFIPFLSPAFPSSPLSSFLFGLHTISVTIPSARFNKAAALFQKSIQSNNKYMYSLR